MTRCFAKGYVNVESHLTVLRLAELRHRHWAVWHMGKSDNQVWEKQFPKLSHSVKSKFSRNPGCASFSVKASGCSLSQQEHMFVAWMRQRAVRAESITLWCDSCMQDPG